MLKMCAYLFVVGMALLSPFQAFAEETRATPRTAGRVRWMPYEGELRRVTPECLIRASEEFQVPLALILTILDVEGGSIGMEADNANRTADLGPMQVNTIHLPSVARFGISRSDLVFDGCINVYVGTWLLRGHLDRQGDYLEALGHYHSATPSKKRAYQLKAAKAYKELRADPESAVDRILLRANHETAIAAAR